jgi:Fe-S-cluster-containing hydrogenase component 2
MDNLRLCVNPVPCTGCMNCVVVCAQGRAGDHVPGASSFSVLLDPFGGEHRHVYCRQCENPSCAEACPSGAIVRDTGTGAMVIDEGLCIHCRACVAACPFGAVFWRDDPGLPVKCDLCSGSPRCAAACRFGVIRFLSPDDPGYAFRGMPDSEQDPLLGRGEG